ncbi:uncharacterized protein LOC132783863 [Drosophila nasuta]|uniref:uncharacterized protein LOC132783863 n=1 Tax=Drosophila nasuta TaxID=42062 RepID=UPI00295ED628|nr:uncharacterized protein LOC132783863 [Drosophila nasuta]
MARGFAKGYRVWYDWKANIRKKIAQNKAEVRVTGGGPYCQQPLTAMEEDVAKLCGLFEMVEGVGAVAYGAPTTIIEEEVAKEKAEEIATEEEEPSRKRRRTAAEVDLQSLCVAQVEEMKLINSTMSKHFQKMESLAQEDLHLKKEHFQKMETLRQEDLNLKKELLLKLEQI